MIKINTVEYSKNPVKTNEAFLISIAAMEEMATWNDVKAKTWSEIKPVTWDKVKRKIF